MVRPALILAAFAVTFVAGCDSSDKKPFTTSGASPPVALPSGVKLPDQKAPPSNDAKPGKTEPR